RLKSFSAVDTRWGLPLPLQCGAIGDEIFIKQAPTEGHVIIQNANSIEKVKIPALVTRYPLLMKSDNDYVKILARCESIEFTIEGRRPDYSFSFQATPRQKMRFTLSLIS